MKKVLESILTNPAARSETAAKHIAYKQTEFTPWEGGE